jgi:hypothetical protein
MALDIFTGVQYDLQTVDPGATWEADIQSNVIDALDEATKTTPTALSFGQLAKAKLAYLAPITTAANTTSFACTQLIGYGNDYFANWYTYVVWDAGGASAAPQGEYKLITDYVSSTGTFTISAFTEPHVVTDKVMIVHPSIAISTVASLSTYNLDHLVALADSGTTSPTKVVDNSILGIILTSDSGGDISDFDNSKHSLQAIGTDTDTLITTIGTPMIPADITTADKVAIADTYGNSNPRVVTKTLSTLTALDNLFTVTGLVDIISITSFFTTGMGTARTLRWGIYDATLSTEQFFCAASASTAFAAGTLLGITGTITDAMVGTTAVGQIESQSKSLTERPTTTGTIRQTAAGLSTGVEVIEILWIPKNAAGNIVAL